MVCMNKLVSISLISIFLLSDLCTSQKQNESNSGRVQLKSWSAENKSLRESTSVARDPFYIKDHMGVFDDLILPRLQIDIVKVDTMLKPTFDASEVYPEQVAPEQGQTGQFQFNPELIANVFKSGYNISSEQFKNVNIFPHDIDNKVQFQEDLQVSHHIDDVKRRSATKKSSQKNYYEDEEEDDDTYDEVLGDEDEVNNRLTVKYSFSINRIEFNSILNKSILDILQDEMNRKNLNEQVRQIIHAFVTEYLRNQRQFAYYLIDCDVINCKDQRLIDAQEFINQRSEENIWLHFSESEEYGPITFISIKDRAMNEIKGLLETSSNVATNYRNDPSVAMFKRTLDQLEEFIDTNLEPLLSKFSRIINKFDFDSPLNFIMTQNDFGEFREIFYHGQLLTRYSVNIMTDSFFSMDEELTKIGHSRRVQEKKQEAVQTLLKSFQTEIKTLKKQFKNYDHLIEHDQQDCQKHFSFGCFQRKYGVTLIFLLVDAIVAYFGYQLFASKMEKQRQRKLL